MQSTFMGQLRNGEIGGVMCGNDPNDIPVYKSEDAVLVNQDLYNMLMKHRQVSVDMKFLIQTSALLIGKNVKKTYALTKEAIDKKDFILITFAKIKKGK